MAKIQNSRKSIRYAQNVRRVPISMGNGFKNPKRPILDQICRTIENPKFWDPRGSPIWGPIGPRAFFLQTPVSPCGPNWPPLPCGPHGPHWPYRSWSQKSLLHPFLPKKTRKVIPSFKDCQTISPISSEHHQTPK